MEELSIFLVFVGIIATVIQIIVLVKFFQMASDIRAIRGIQERRCDSACDGQPVSEANGRPRTSDSPAKASEVKSGSVGELSYTLSGDTVEFVDGLKGKIVRYQGYKECSVITDDNFELLYNDFDCAIAALHAYLLDKSTLQEGLYEKRQYKK